MAGCSFITEDGTGFDELGDSGSGFITRDGSGTDECTVEHEGMITEDGTAGDELATGRGTAAVRRSWLGRLLLWLGFVAPV